MKQAELSMQKKMKIKKVRGIVKKMRKLLRIRQQHFDSKGVAPLRASQVRAATTSTCTLRHH